MGDYLSGASITLCIFYVYVTVIMDFECCFRFFFKEIKNKA